jgi:hypothetical protein
MKIVIDTSPLISLGVLGQLDLLNIFPLGVLVIDGTLKLEICIKCVEIGS